MDFQSLRKEYEDQGIVVHDLDENPLNQLELWLKDAVEHSPGRWMEVNVMALATAGNSGDVSVRYVLLKGIATEGIQFFTNYDSQKGQQLEENPNCSVAFHWPHLGRQVRITGVVEKTSREISEDYFHSRPRSAQIGASVSAQSSVIESREHLQQLYEDREAELTEAEIPLPENWGGYLIKPARFEFWQGRTGRLHDRIVYTFESKHWVKSRLAP